MTARVSFVHRARAPAVAVVWIAAFALVGAAAGYGLTLVPLPLENDPRWALAWSSLPWAVGFALALTWLVPAIGLDSRNAERGVLALLAFGITAAATRRATLFQILGAELSRLCECAGQLIVSVFGGQQLLFQHLHVIDQREAMLEH